MQDTVNDHENRITVLEDHYLDIRDRLSRVEVKVEGLEKRMGRLESRLDQIEQRRASDFKWLVGVLVVSWVSLTGTIFGTAVMF